MSNNVVNEICLTNGSASAILRFLDTFCDKDEDSGIWKIDFKKVIPMPEGMVDTEDACWDWCDLNWGTKWNAYAHAKPKFGHGYGYLRFETAWTPPSMVVLEMSCRFPHIEITHYWADEDFGRNCGYRIIKGGLVIDEWAAPYEEYSDKGIEFAKLVWNGKNIEDEDEAQ